MGQSEEGGLQSSMVWKQLNAMLLALLTSPWALVGRTGPQIFYEPSTGPQASDHHLFLDLGFSSCGLD